MLVLSRKTNEQILIPGLNITITVLSVGPNRVQLGIDAPRNIDITRPDATRPETCPQQLVIDREIKLSALLV